MTDERVFYYIKGEAAHKELTLRDLAKRLDISYNTLQRQLKDLNYLSVKTMFQISKILHIDFDEFCLQAKRCMQ